MASLVVNYRHEEKAWETLEQLEGVLPTVCMGPDGRCKCFAAPWLSSRETVPTLRELGITNS
jgi:hypothetical protein